MGRISTDERYYTDSKNIKILQRRVLAGIFENSNQFTFFNMNVLAIQVSFSGLKLNNGPEQERLIYFGGA